MFEEEKFKFDVENIKKDFAIENININEEDIGLLKKISNNEITMDQMIGDIKNSINKEIL